MTSTPWLKSGQAIETCAIISRNSSNIKIIKWENIREITLPAKAFGRIHSEAKGVYTVWLLGELASDTIIVDVPLSMMGSLFVPSRHTIFPSIGR